MTLNPKYEAALRNVRSEIEEAKKNTAEQRRTPTGLGAVLAEKQRQGELPTEALVAALRHMLRAPEPLHRQEEYLKHAISRLGEQRDLTGVERRTVEAAFDDAGNMEKPIRPLRRMFCRRTTK